MKYACTSKLMTAFAALTIGAPVLAQDVGIPSTDGKEQETLSTSSAGPDAATAAQRGLEEIVVSAQKRSESLQEVPISVQAMTSEQVERLYVPTLQGLNGLITNAQINNFTNTPHNAVVTIRGIGIIEPDLYAGNTVSIVVDGVPQVFSVGALVDLYDIERVEVLKGPQGTLFGANTTGGVVNIVTRQPDEEFGGQFEATTGNWDRLNLAGAVNIPLADTLFSRFAVSHFQRDGFLTNVVNGKDMGHKKTTIFRGALKYAPDADFDVTLSGEYNRSRNGSPELTISAAPAESGPSRVQPGSIVQYGPESMYVDPAQVPNMYALPCPSRFERCTAPDDYYGAISSIPDRSDMDTYRATLTLNLWDTALGDVTAITGYKDFKVTTFTDQDSSPLFGADTRVETTGWQLTQELRTSVDFTDRWNAIVGAFYLKTHYDHVQDFRMNFATFPPFAGFFQQNLQDQDQWSGSLFAQSYYHLTDSVKLTAGLRYSYEKTEMRASTISYLAATPDEFTFDCAVTCTGTIPGMFPGGPVVSGKENWSNFGWKLGLDWQATDDTLLYASWTRGFKSGGFVGRLGIAEDLGPFDPEKVDTYEAGIKADFFDRRLRFNLTGFYTDYRDMQLSQIYFLIDPAMNTYIQGNTILNAAQSTIKGFELGTAVMPIDGLTLRADLGYLDAKYDDFPYIDPFSVDPAVNPTGITYNLEGNRLQNAPKWTAVLGASYELELPNDHRLLLSGTYKYTSSKFLTSIDNSPRSYIQPTNLFDANVEYFFSDRASISLWGRNLFDKRYIQSVYDNFGYGAFVSYQNPREYGVTTRLNF